MTFPGVTHLSHHTGQLSQTISLGEHSRQDLLNIQVIERSLGRLSRSLGHHRPLGHIVGKKLRVGLAGLGRVRHTLTVVRDKNRADITQIITPSLGQLVELWKWWSVLEYRRYRHNTHSIRVAQSLHGQLAGQHRRQKFPN